MACATGDLDEATPQQRPLPVLHLTMCGINLQCGALALVARCAAKMGDGMLSEQHLPVRMRAERLFHLLESRPIDPKMAGGAPINGQDRLLELVDRQALHHNLFHLRGAALDRGQPTF